MAVFETKAWDWQWLGWRPWTWKLRSSMETGEGLRYDIGPIPAIVPGTVQQALRDAGMLPDWRVGMNSLQCEWVEHRHWELLTTLPAGLLPTDQTIVLHADALDYSGWILVDGRQVAAFSGALSPQWIDLTEALGDGGKHHLSIVFDIPPREQGQIGFTSQSRYFKPRYNYGWDWCPRFVPIGVAGGMRLLTGHDARLRVDQTWTDLADDLCTGSLETHIFHEGEPPPESQLDITVRDGDRVLGKCRVPLQAGGQTLRLGDLTVEPWWPNGEGEARLYDLDLTMLHGGQSVWQRHRSIGFKRVRWRQNQHAPADAMPWICEVNGRCIFLQGVNWTPVRMAYPDTPPEEYRHRVECYRAMGCNLLRVWGGAYLGTEAFFQACDETGLMVWQEFPLSSSGIDNWPPEDPDVIQTLLDIEQTYIERRAHHVSLLMWCGGNELQGGLDGSKTGVGLPAPPEHPCLSALEALAQYMDPTRRFLPTSPSGPRFYASPEEFGKGLHHEVHGPWGYDGNMEALEEYWRHDDALFRAEVGVPGACDAALIERYAPDGASWPPDNPTWAHSSLWWLMPYRYEPLKHLPPAEALAEYVRSSQADQAKAYATIARACKKRFPQCGGFLVWHGHDCFPCPVNNSIIDVEGNPKPAYYALRDVFLEPTTDPPAEP